MLHSYPDITKRITDPILWYDENGVPRFDPFHPDLCANIYAREVVLLRIQCAACSKQFEVALNWHPIELPGGRSLRSRILDKPHTVACGDPPCFDCSNGCGAGMTMQADVIGVVEFWESRRGNWHRVRSLEGLLPLDP